MPGGGIPAAMKAPGGAINPCWALNAAAIKEVMVCINKKIFTCLTDHRLCLFLQPIHVVKTNIFFVFSTAIMRLPY